VRSRTNGMWWGTVIESPDPSGLAKFYSDLPGWPIGHEEPGMAIVEAPRDPSTSCSSRLPINGHPCGLPSTGNSAR
jgi:hypothetical protein